MDVDRPGPLYHLLDHRAMGELVQPAVPAPAQEKLARVLGGREVEQGGGHVGASDLGVCALQLGNQRALRGKRRGRRLDGAVGNAHMHGEQFAVPARGHAGTAADEHLAVGSPAQRDQDAFLGLAGLAQLVDVLPALGVAAAGDVRVRQLVDQGHGRVAGEHRVDIHFLDRAPPVGERAAGNNRQIADLRRGVGPSVDLHESDGHIAAAGAAAAPLLQHRIGLAHPRGRPEVDTQLSACGDHGDQPGRRSSARFSSSTLTPGSPRKFQQLLVVPAPDQRHDGGHRQMTNPRWRRPRRTRSGPARR